MSPTHLPSVAEQEAATAIRDLYIATVKALLTNQCSLLISQTLQRKDRMQKLETETIRGSCHKNTLQLIYRYVVLCCLKSYSRFQEGTTVQRHWDEKIETGLHCTLGDVD